jgi:hypothetical protein
MLCQGGPVSDTCLQQRISWQGAPSGWCRQEGCACWSIALAASCADLPAAHSCTHQVIRADAARPLPLPAAARARPGPGAAGLRQGHPLSLPTPHRAEYRTSHETQRARAV